MEIEGDSLLTLPRFTNVLLKNLDGIFSLSGISLLAGDSQDSSIKLELPGCSEESALMSEEKGSHIVCQRRMSHEEVTPADREQPSLFFATHTVVPWTPSQEKPIFHLKFLLWSKPDHLRAAEDATVATENKVLEASEERDAIAQIF